MALRMSARKLVLASSSVQKTFREAAADEQGVAGGQTRVAQGIERYQFGAGGDQRVEVVGIVEAEGGIAGDGDAQWRVGDWLPGRPRWLG